MAENRIKIAKDKASLVKELKGSDTTTGLFQTYVDVIVFAAALGAKRKKRIPLVEFARDLDPIRRDYFNNNRCELLINLLALITSQNQSILSDDEQSDDRRIEIFEEYANGGLEILQQELRGVVDYSEQLLLILSAERFNQELQGEEFNLTRFLS